MPSEPRCLDQSADGMSLAVLCAGGELMLLDAAARVTQKWQAHAASLSNNWWLNNGAVRFSPDSQNILTWGTDNFVRVWNVSTALLRYEPLAHEKRPVHLGFSPNGKLLATAAWDNNVRVWDLDTGRQIGAALTHPDWVNAAHFSPNGEQILTACRDFSARLWDWRKGRLACPPFRHGNEVHAVAFLPDGRRVLTTAFDQTARLWETTTGKPLTPPLKLPGGGLSVQVTREGRSAVIGGMLGDKIALLRLDAWLKPDECSVNELCLWAELLSGKRVEQGGDVTNLTESEWLDRWRDFRQRHPGHTALPAVR